MENASKEYDLEGILVRVEPAFLVKLDTEHIKETLREKLSRKESLDMEEQMQLMVLPLTVKGTRNKQQMIIETVELARQIHDQQQRTQVLAGILTFTDKIIDENYRNRVKEKWKMTQIGKMIFDDGYRAGEIEGQNKARSRAESWAWIRS